MNNSHLYTSLRTLKAELEDKLNHIEEYLTPGSATTVIKFFNSRNQEISKRTISGKWTTALGEHRVRLNHDKYVAYHTENPPRDATRVQVSGPFFNTRSTTVRVKFTDYREVKVNFS